MAIIADVEDLSAAEFLLMLSLNRKSGKLTAVRDEHKVMVTVRLGSVVYAASTSMRERVGNILVSRRLVTEAQLRTALQRQESEEGVKHLGNILVEMGLITEELLEEVVRSQFQRVLGELLSWDSGLLTFAGMEIPDLGAVHVDPREILVDMGFETEQLVLGSMSQLEDGQRAEAGGELAVASAQPGPAARTPREPIAVQRSSGLKEYLREAISDDAQALMRSMIQEMQSLSLSLTAEITVELLGRASEVVKRGVLMLVHPDHLAGAGGFGLESQRDSVEELIRQLVIPRSEDSVFSRVIASQRSYRGALESTVYNDVLVRQLGGDRPVEVIAVPLTLEGQVAAILYGDNAPQGDPIGPLEDLEALMVSTARTLEASRGPMIVT